MKNLHSFFAQKKSLSLTNSFFEKVCTIFIISFFILAISCKDESIAIPDNQNSKALTDQKILSETKTESKSARSTSKIDEFELIWKNAIVKKYSFGEGIIVPVKYKNPKKPLYYIDEVKNKGKNKKLISTLSNSDLDYMFIRLDEKRRVIKKLISIIPDQDYLIRSKNMKLKNVEFEGLKFVKDENGKIEYGFKYVKNIKSKNLNNSKNAKINGEWCYTVDYYSCFSVGDGAENCEYNFSDTFCLYYSDQDNTPEPGNGQGGGNGGDGGGNNNGGGATDPYQTLTDLINSSNSSSDLLSSDLLEENGTNRRKSYVWRAIDGLTWDIKSYETGTHTKVGNEWQWSSVDHNSLGFEGYVAGGSMEYNKIQTQKEVGIYYAIIEHTIGLTFKVGIGDLAITEGKTVTSSKVLYVND